MALKIQESSENYLETIYILKQTAGYVRSIDIVNYLGFSKPSIRNAMKNLREHGYVTVDDKVFISLTDIGSEIALTMRSAYHPSDVHSRSEIEFAVFWVK